VLPITEDVMLKWRLRDGIAGVMSRDEQALVHAKRRAVSPEILAQVAPV
jgi:hypothetical protein